MDGSRLTPLLAVSLLFTSGCIDGLPSVQPDGFELEDLPGMGGVDLSDARLKLDLESCRETHLILTGNATAVQAEVPGDFQLAEREENETKLTVSLIHCRQISTGNHTTYDVSLLEVTAPIQNQGVSPKRDDALLAIGTNNETLATRLDEAGLPVKPVENVEREQQRSYRIAEQSTLDVDAGGYSFTGQVTSVSIETELPFGTAGSIGRTGWAIEDNETLEVRRGLNVTDVGGISSTLVLSPSGPLAELAGNRTASAHGFEAHYDARMGVVPEGAGGSSWGLDGLWS